MNKSEIELTRQYLNKVHDFKTAKTQVIKKGIIEDNFGAYAEGFGSGAIRDFTAICGKNGIIFDDIFKTTKTGDYLLSYASGAGSYTSCSGVGVSADFNTKNVAAFNHIFGSFFGDYDIKNNFMRTSLATDKMGLTCMWSGRPKWVTHTLGLGENYGEITKRSQNNWLNYDANYYQNGTHMALLGDPSLRHDMLASPGPLTLEGSNEKTETNLSWTASSESGILGYHIYRSHKSHGGYILLNSTPTTDLTYMDVSPYEGTNHYMVRTVKETMTGSGSYINLSLGVVKEINGMKGQMANVQESITALSSKVYPTISSETITLETKSTQSMKYIVINTLGSQVASGMTNGKKTSIRISDLGSGCYYVLLNGKTLRFIKN